jgi:hypothetical protein
MRRRLMIAKRVLKLTAAGAALAGVLASALPEAACCAELGRLFFSPEQRAQMNRMRFARPPAAAVETPAAEPLAPPPTSPRLVTLDGYVSRSSGHSTTWVNGVPQNDRLHMDRDAVRIEDENRHAIDLKVGESYDVNSGARRRLLNNGTVNTKQ